MTKLTKYQKERLSAMPTLEEVQREYYTKHPQETEGLKKAALEEYANDPTMSARELLAILRRIVELEGYTKFAKRAHMAREHVYRAVKPNANPTLSTIEKLADTCGLRVGFIYK